MNILYGTAWKEERTTELTTQAIAAGFRGIDTANQRKHYYEEGVGKALSQVLAAGLVTRSELFLQTKFTYLRGQDHRLPFDRHAPVGEQVRQSFASSLKHLGTDYLDSYLIHGPEHAEDLSANDWTVWRVMEELHESGLIRNIGFGNISATQVKALMAGARIKPKYIQNRCYPSIAWDRPVRELCRDFGIVYQGFNLLADPLVWKSPAVGKAARRLAKTQAQVLYSFALKVGMLPLTGTTNPAHMQEALLASDIALTPDEITAFAAIS